MNTEEQKIFEDFFGKEIKIGDYALHLYLWATVIGGNIYGGESAIKHKLVKVMGFSKKGVRIEWREKEKIKQSTIFNTNNRLIILKNNLIEVDEEVIINNAMKDYEKYKKKMITEQKKLKEKIEEQQKEILCLKEKIEDLNRFSKFGIMDI